MTPAEKSRFDAAVQEAVEKAMAAQHKQYARLMESTMKNSLKGVDKANAELKKAYKAVQKELDVAKKAAAKAEKEGDKMAEDYFAGRQKQFMEAARTDLLRQLTREHLEAGKTSRDIALWLDLSLDFVESIRELLGRTAKYAGQKRKRLHLDGRPKLRYQDSGRGGTIWFESIDTRFDMWWEFAGGNALVIVDIPTEAQWEARTKLPLAQRNDTLTFIGEQVVADKISGEGSFIIGENVLTFYAGDK